MINSEGLAEHRQKPRLAVDSIVLISDSLSVFVHTSYHQNFAVIF